MTLFDYAPFGEELGSYDGRDARWAGFGSGVHYTGKEQEGYEGAYMHYFGARYFSGGLGRFTSPDPGNFGANPADPQSWNGYAYVRNSPLALVDPVGLSSSCVVDGATIPCSLAGSESTVRCPNNDCTDIFANAEGNVYRNVRLPNLSLICPSLACRDGYWSTSSWQFVAGPEGDIGAQVLWRAGHNLQGFNGLMLGFAGGSAGAGALAAGAPALGAAAARGAATAVGWGYGLTGGTGVVLGTYVGFGEEGGGPNYIDAARAMGANVYNIRPQIWSALSSMGQTWTANRAFIDASIWRGQQFFLSAAPTGTTGTFAQELQYLTSRGVGPSQWQMVRLPY